MIFVDLSIIQINACGFIVAEISHAQKKGWQSFDVDIQMLPVSIIIIQ